MTQSETGADRATKRFNEKIRADNERLKDAPKPAKSRQVKRRLERKGRPIPASR